MRDRRSVSRGWDGRGLLTITAMQHAPAFLACSSQQSTCCLPPPLPCPSPPSRAPELLDAARGFAGHCVHQLPIIVAQLGKPPHCGQGTRHRQGSVWQRLDTGGASRVSQAEKARRTTVAASKPRSWQYTRKHCSHAPLLDTSCGLHRSARLTSASASASSERLPAHAGERGTFRHCRSTAKCEPPSAPKARGTSSHSQPHIRLPTAPPPRPPTWVVLKRGQGPHQVGQVLAREVLSGRRLQQAARHLISD